MKKGICMILAATLLCISIAGCSAPGQGESITSSGVNNSQSVSGMEPSSQSSVSLQSSVPASSSASTNATASQQEEEQWVSPTGMDVYTSKALYEYYEANPELKEYYYTYMVPLGIMIDEVWKKTEEIDITSLVMWVVFSYMPVEERNQTVFQGPYRDYTGEFPFISEDLIEPVIAQYFGIDASILRASDMYEERNAGYFTGFLGGFGEHTVFVLQDAEENEEEIVLTYQQWAEENFPEMRFHYEGDGKIYQLHIRLNKDGTFQYLKNILLDEGWQIPKAE